MNVAPTAIERMLKALLSRQVQRVHDSSESSGSSSRSMSYRSMKNERT